MPTDNESLQKLLEEIRAEFPGFKIVPKAHSLFMRVVGVVLWVLTFGAQRSFMVEYTTVIRYTVYTPEAWERWPDHLKESLLRHERVHMRQCRRYTFPLYTLLYLFVPLPLGLAYYRAKFEKEAYAETMRLAYQRYGQAILHSKTYRQNILRQFTTGKYGWMWPFPKAMERWYWETVKAVRPRESLNAVWSEDEAPTVPEGKSLPPK